MYHLVRAAGKDDIIPLSQPITTVDGEVINEIPVGKGQGLMFSICAYNRYRAMCQIISVGRLTVTLATRLESVWGPDAADFNPMRFMEESETIDNTVKVGMYATL